ncbi:MAG TPA: phosphoribosylglycinamide formyltransferase [Pyrinomonadaceae bacterium]|nr:phosphoribosylglycinamide formyltransferase [Pyrinomonadaceae bacterium]
MDQNQKKPKASRIAVLISGRGSNMVALSDSIRNGVIINAEIVIVVSDKADAAGVNLARERGLNTVVIERLGRKREEHEAEVIEALQQHNVDLICLAGYMRVLSPIFVQTFTLRILNIHPSLLPSFPGLKPQQQALDHGVKLSGCTVHFVDNALDGGPIVAQRAVPVLDDDSEESLSARILEEEHVLYAEAVNRIVNSDYRVDGRRVLIDRPQ